MATQPSKPSPQVLAKLKQLREEFAVKAEMERRRRQAQDNWEQSDTYKKQYPQGQAEGGTVKEPKSTVKAYKLFRVHPNHPGKLFPLFVNANEPVEMGKWQDAQIGEMTGNKVKSKIGPLAFRPGWHAGDVPVATHIGEKSDPNLTAPDRRPDNHVWAEVEMPDDVDWQSEATKRGTNAQGRVVPVKAHITDQIPKGGHYRYKTNPNMTGNWLIGGSMKVNRVLDDKEVRSINKAAGVADLPRTKPFNAKKYGFAGGGTVAPEEWKAEEHVNYLPQKEREANKEKFIAESKVKHKMYRGQPASFNAEPLHYRYFTSDPAYASSYGKDEESGQNILPVYIHAKKVYTPSDVNKVTDYNFDRDALLKKGYDAIATKDHSVVVPLRGPHQVKSAIGNRGTYDPNDPDITKARGGRVTHAHHLEIEERPL